jgi:hypothetical protein
VIPHGMEVYVALDPIDLRWGFDRLAGVVTERYVSTIMRQPMHEFTEQRLPRAGLEPRSRWGPWVAG